MSILKRYLKITDLTIFVIVFIFFSTLKAQNLSKLDSADNISDYFSGILLLNDGKYIESNRYLKKLNGLEKSHSNYSCLLYTSPSPRDRSSSRMPSSA